MLEKFYECNEGHHDKYYKLITLLYISKTKYIAELKTNKKNRQLKLQRIILTDSKKLNIQHDPNKGSFCGSALKNKMCIYQRTIILL